jgi:hypothetical protein
MMLKIAGTAKRYVMTRRSLEAQPASAARQPRGLMGRSRTLTGRFCLSFEVSLERAILWA